MVGDGNGTLKDERISRWVNRAKMREKGHGGTERDHAGGSGEGMLI